MKRDEKIARLVEGFESNKLSSTDMAELEQLIAEGVIDSMDFKSIAELDEKLTLDLTAEPSGSLNARFYTMLSKERKGPSFFEKFNEVWQVKPLVRWAYSFVLIAGGFAIGLLFRPNGSSSSEISQLSAEVQDMKEMMMLSLLEEESISDRLRAVSLTNELPDASTKITSALLKTLNNDDNVNVRLGALEALLPYADDSEVRMGLIASIAKQESPLVQMGLAEMMLALQEKRSIQAFEELLDRESTPIEVKKKINETLEILI